MRIRRKVVAAALVAVAVIGTLASSASARNLSWSSTTFRVVWRPLILAGAGGLEVRCDVTFEGSFHERTFAKMAASLIGYIASVSVDRATCVGGNLYALNGRETLNGTTVDNTLPWHIRYRSFLGSLPDITHIVVDVLGLSFLAEALSMRCLYRSEVSRPARFRIERSGSGRILRWIADETVEIPKVSGDAFCPNPARLRGSESTVTNGRTEVTLTLI
jgi:hypothetical protein